MSHPKGTRCVPYPANAIRQGNSVQVINLTKDETYETEHPMTPYQVEMVLAGSLINLVKQKDLSPAKNKPGKP